MHNLGVLTAKLDDRTLAQDQLKHTLILAREVGDTGGEVRSLTDLGVLARQVGRHPEAVTTCRKLATVPA